jgi:predicted DNA repair protein MutK
MAGASLLTLLDDITALLDDVSAMTKVAASKTAGVVGDDLALNAKQVLGTPAERELPVVWKVAKGSFINKAILVPVAILLSAFLPFLVKPLLMLGGLYLCYEGAEKIILRHHPEQRDASLTEDDKIKGAIRTDFILSAEIIILTLGVVADDILATRIMVLASIGIGMTIFVYGLVAAIVKLDDFGLYLTTKDNVALNKTGQGILIAAPYLMRGLGILGTAAMFVVGGQIIAHGIPLLHVLPAHGIMGVICGGLTGLVCGYLCVLGHNAFVFLRAKTR